jgi:hypothetical protein
VVLLEQSCVPRLKLNSKNLELSMPNKRPFHVVKTLLAVLIIMMLSISASVYAKSKDFHSPNFDMSLATNLNLISKTEEKNNGFYRYTFASSNNDDAELQIRVIVSSKSPESNQSLEDFETASIGAMSAMFMDSNKLYQYINTPENQKVLSQKPYKLKLGSASFAGVTMYFGNIDASFLVTRSHNMTYAFTLISQSSNEQTRKNNLKLLTNQLQSIKFNSASSNE